jgi:hypothetical protein
MGELTSVGILAAFGVGVVMIGIHSRGMLTGEP